MIKILNLKVSDIVALMKIAISICKKDVPEKEWKIWRLVEFVLEFVDDQNDKEEDTQNGHEQFNSIVQLQRLGVEIKDVIAIEIQELLSKIKQVEDDQRKRKLMIIYRKIKQEVLHKFG